MNAQPLIPAPSDASTLMAATTVCAWRASSSVLRTQHYANLFLVRRRQFNKFQTHISDKSPHTWAIHLQTRSRSSSLPTAITWGSSAWMPPTTLCSNRWGPCVILMSTEKLCFRILSCSKTNAAPVLLTGLKQCRGSGLRLSPADDLLDRCQHAGQHDPTDAHQWKKRSGLCESILSLKDKRIIKPAFLASSC